ncbi:molecular chaperone Hsp90 [Streptomyces sp. AJS327]|nr:molecular chaperone Hsp90 [Streptomyces sp. AJS327]MBA0053241.1 molecular chaperone Hsp90 [Streptomyces sp. AJS327]
MLDAWAASPARFREDANAEQDLALGGYRDRLVVELAQNAADAAARAHIPGHLLLTLADGVLTASNTGAPLDVQGVESLSTLRASAKRESTDDRAVGRFGVGFSAVLAVTDEPAVLGRAGGVRWSLAEARDAAGRAAGEGAADPGLAAELQRRSGHVPLLRLPLPVAPAAPDGAADLGGVVRRTDLTEFDTSVVLPLRDAAAEELAHRLLTGIDDALLLTLPALERITVRTAEGVRELSRESGEPARVPGEPTRDGARGRASLVTVRDSAAGATRWRVTTLDGVAAPELLADRPTEERERPGWSITWAVPVDPETGAPARPRTAPRVHAPTPTDEPLGLPALLIGTFPLEPTRRHLAPGPLTDFLLDRAAETYAGLLRDWRPLGTGVLDLVPAPLGTGETDGALRARVLALLPRVRFLPPATAVPSGDAASAERPAAGREMADAEPDSRRAAGGSDVLGAPGTGAGYGPGDADSRTDAGELTDGDVESGPIALRPLDAELVEGAGAATVAVLAELFPSLLPAGLERRAELRALEVERVPLGEVIDRLAGVERPPSWWFRLYDALAGTDPDRLSGLPVPLAGTPGRTAIGPRQVLLPLPTGTADADSTDGTDGRAAAYGDELPLGEGALMPEGGRNAVLAGLGLKVAHPDSVHPLLEKLGATPATPRAVLTTPQVRAAVAGSLDSAESGWAEEAPDWDELVETVLGLVGEARLDPGDEPWLGALALPDEDGEPVPAAELVFPGSPFQRVIFEGELGACDQELADRWGQGPLTAVGVQAGFALVRATDVVLDPDELAPRDSDFPEPDDPGYLDSVDVWCEDVLDQLPETPLPPVAAELVAVRDLDLVDDDHWPEALAMLSQPPLREALTAPVRVLLPDGTAQHVRPHTAWWLRGHPVLDGRRPAGLRASGGDPLLAGLYEEADTSAVRDEQVLRALGVRTSALALLDEPGGAAELLARLADPDAEVSAAQLHALYGLLARLDPDEVTLPDEVRALCGDQLRVVDAARVRIADAPDLLPLAGDRPLLPVAPAHAADLAALLDVRRLSESLPAPVTEPGVEREVPEAVRVLLPAAPRRYREHDELLVTLGTADSDDAGGGAAELDWRHTPDGVVHAATLEGLAAGLAWAAGAWPRRFEVAALLEDPSRTAELARARWFD